MKIITQAKTLLIKKPIYLISLVLILIIIINLTGIFNDAELTDAQVSESTPIVTLISAREYTGSSPINLIGTIRPVAEANITTERSGRVVNVPVKLGDSVRTGQIIASLENASEQASVLQAQGVYEAALANSASNDVGLDQAKTALNSAKQKAVSTFKSTYNTINGLILNSIDPFFSNPNTPLIGLRISGKGYTATLNNERKSYQSLLPEWQQRANNLNTKSNLVSELNYALDQVKKTINFIDTFIVVLNSQTRDSQYSETELQSLIANFTGLKGNLLSIEVEIENSLNGLTNAENNLRRAEVSSSGSSISLVDAQVKQALGTLRAAEANLAKTILRSPINGTINNLSVKTGDFVNAFTSIAKVANNDALEIITFVNESEKSLFAIGDEISIENKYSGIVTSIAPAIDPTTRKIEVRIITDNTNLTSGNTVRLIKQKNIINDNSVDSQPLTIPLSAVKFELEDGYVFLVENSVLVAKPVTLGAIKNGSVIISTGLNFNDEFVLDARGLTAGTKVEVNSQ